ncbi:MAG: hypothetical protein AB1489_41805, partial [Acidobacteriota bacterium]
EQAEQIWWESLSGMQTNEDEAFLLYCLGKKQQITEVGLNKEEPIYQLTELTEAVREIHLKPSVLVDNFTTDFKHSNVATTPVVAFYDQSQDLAVNIAAHTGKFLMHCLSYGFLPEKLDRNIRETVNLLLRYQLVEVNGEGIVKLLYASQLSDYPDATISWNSDYHIFQVRPGRFECFNMISQDLVSVNTIAAWIAALVQSHSLSFEELIRLAVEEIPGLTADAVKQVVEELVERNVLMALFEDPSRENISFITKKISQPVPSLI